MDVLTSDTLRGIWSPVLLPLDEDDAIDFGRLEESLAAVVGSGVDGVYTNGTAGEFDTLSEEEYDRLHALVVRVCAAAGVPYQLGASHPGGRLSLERVRRAAALEPGAIQVVLPDWLPLQDDEAVAALRGFAAAAGGVPLVLYNPPYAKTRATPALLARIAADVPEVVGLKLPSVEPAAGLTDRFAVFAAGHTLATGYRAGAAGSYSNVSCMSPAGAVRWYRLMATEPRAAAEVEERLRAFLDQHIAPLAAAGYSDPALDKTLCAVGGWSRTGTRVRWPHRWLPQDAVPPLREAALAAVPDLLAEPLTRPSADL